MQNAEMPFNFDSGARMSRSAVLRHMKFPSLRHSSLSSADIAFSVRTGFFVPMNFCLALRAAMVRRPSHQLWSSKSYWMRKPSAVPTYSVLPLHSRHVISVVAAPVDTRSLSGTRSNAFKLILDTEQSSSRQLCHSSLHFSEYSRVPNCAAQADDPTMRDYMLQVAIRSVVR